MIKFYFFISCGKYMKHENRQSFVNLHHHRILNKLLDEYSYELHHKSIR